MARKTLFLPIARAIGRICGAKRPECSLTLFHFFIVSHIRYERLILSGKLYKHPEEADPCCSDRMDRLIRQMAETEGINEKLKASDQLGWISRMNSIHQRAEEIILDELVFT